jgi:hypothetical protein
LIKFGGGIPIRNAKRQILGGTGVSGASKEDDATCAQVGLDAVKEVRPTLQKGGSVSGRVADGDWKAGGDRHRAPIGVTGFYRGLAKPSDLLSDESGPQPPDPTHNLSAVALHRLNSQRNGDLKSVRVGCELHLLLSRHPISQANRTIYKKGAGEDDWSFKGVLHARIRPLGHPCEYDVFLSHTQNLTPIVGEDDAKDALAHQIRHLGSFIRACRDPSSPALLMGDLNVDGYDPAHQALLDLLYAEMGVPTALAPPQDVIGGEQLWPQVRIFGDKPARPFATSESESSHISSFNDGNDDRAANNEHRFGPTSQRLDYFFTWRGLLCEPRYPEELTEVRVIQSSPGKDMSDHYGLSCRFTTVRQALPSSSVKLGSLVVSPRRVRCLNTTEGSGSDKVAFTFQCVAADGRQWSEHTRRFDEVSPGAELDVSGPQFTIPSPGAFVVITASGLEFDRLSGHDALGSTQLTLGWRELAALAGRRMLVALPRLTGEGGEYVVEIELFGASA